MEELRRVFAAVPIPDEIRMALAGELRELPIPGRLTPTANWHITLRFLGPVDLVTYERFLGGLSGQPLGPPFRLRLAGVGGFPRPAKATVVWVGVLGDVDRLGELAEMAEDAAQGAGLAPEERPFDPHLTISRVRPPADIRRVVEPGSELEMAWSCDRLVVFESHTGRGHAWYEALETFELTG